MADDVDPNSQQTIADLKNWGGLHAVRTVWNGGIFISFLATEENIVSLIRDVWESIQSSDVTAKECGKRDSNSARVKRTL